MTQQLVTQGLTSTGGSKAIVPIVVEVSAGPGVGTRTVFRSGTLFIGADPTCDFVLTFAHISRRHASLQLLPGEVQVDDLRSRNGTFYLGARIEHARVPLGGSIRIGQSTLQFRPLEAEAPLTERTELHGLIGLSLSMRRLFTALERLGPSDCSVLISGETGTGKEAVARTVHALSGRSAAPFVVFDCGATSSELIHAELFGHARGAFTGANGERPGLVERAHGGTLFLDEIGELPFALQPQLLRLLEARETRRLGDTETRRVDLRVVAATNRRLEDEVAAGRFRSDLFFRLAVAQLEVPSLRERLEDIPALAQRFAREASGFDVKLAPATLVALQCERWPGNVRELRNAVQRVLALGTSRPPAGGDARSLSYLEARDELLLPFERDYLVALLERHGKNLSEAAREAKLARSFLYKLLAKHGLK